MNDSNAPELSNGTDKTDPALAAAREINAILNQTHYVDIAAIIRRHYITPDYDAAIRASRTVQDEFDRLERELTEARDAKTALHAYYAEVIESYRAAKEQAEKERDALASKVAGLEEACRKASLDSLLMRDDLLKDLAAARADTARLDWLNLHISTQETADILGLDYSECHTIRAAIDAAMGSQGGGQQMSTPDQFKARAREILKQAQLDLWDADTSDSCDDILLRACAAILAESGAVEALRQSEPMIFNGPLKGALTVYNNVNTDLAAARADTARLDWLTGNQRFIAGHYEDGWHFDGLGSDWKCFNGDTLRAAIDAAMKEAST